MKDDFIVALMALIMALMTEQEEKLVDEVFD